MSEKRGFIFIDRDGVICEEVNHLHKKEDLRLIPKTGESIKLLNERGYVCIVITNQPVVARGLCSEKEVKEVHNHLNMLLGKYYAKLDGIYYCPHHPTEGNNPEYTRECECRKPKPGMILKAKEDFGIKDSDECYMVGDKISDILAGKKAGCKTILVETGYGGKDGIDNIVPDFKAKNLHDAAVNIILKSKLK